MTKTKRTLVITLIAVAVMISAIAISAMPSPQASALQCVSHQVPSTGGHNGAQAFISCGPSSGPGSESSSIQTTRDANPDAKVSGSQTGFGASPGRH